MDNGNKPAMPLSGDAYQDFAAYDGTKKTSYNPECQGLTKREDFVKAAMQALLVNAGRNGLEFDDVYKESIKQADLHLKALEANNG